MHYVLYPPTNPEHDGAADEAPPLLVHVHGGPTNTTGAAPNQEFSYFTSRGFAVARVDYGGSTGYGRVYRDRLRHTWGIIDVQDSVTVARELAALGLADPRAHRDPRRLGRRLDQPRGAVLHGRVLLRRRLLPDQRPADLVRRAAPTTSSPGTWSHLIGELPRDRDRYEQVSPIGHATPIEVPIVMLQGSDDFICRPSQAQCIVDAVAERGIWHRTWSSRARATGSGRATSVVQSLRAEMELYEHVMGLTMDRGARTSS